MAPVIREALVSGLLTLLAMCVLSTALKTTIALSSWTLPLAPGAFAAIFAFLLTRLTDTHPHSRFGAANTVTTTRLGLTLLLLGLVGVGLDPVTAWVLVTIATLALSLDAVDGILARRQGTVSCFGARYDMEVDALLILVLSILVWQMDKAPAWVLVAGAMRYAFVATSLLLPWLQNELPPNTRRQTVCVSQVLALIVCMAPVIPATWATVLAAIALVALTASFSADICWLARQHESMRSGASV